MNLNITVSEAANVRKLQDRIESLVEENKELNLTLKNSLEAFKKIESEKAINNPRLVSTMRKYASDMASEIEQLHQI